MVICYSFWHYRSLVCYEQESFGREDKECDESFDMKRRAGDAESREVGLLPDHQQGYAGSRGTSGLVLVLLILVFGDGKKLS